jgi:putative hydrolase of the HAD superfamily
MNDATLIISFTVIRPLKPVSLHSRTMTNNNSSTSSSIITSKVSTLIFDVDDTLYDVGCGFSDHRNKEGAPLFMQEFLGLDKNKALQIRNDYFSKYHSTAKALAEAQKDGVFPNEFRQDDLEEFFATRLNFELLGGANKPLAKDLAECPCRLVAFSNGPRAYVKRVLKELGLDQVFGDDKIFAVTDTLPFCKPEKQAFDKIFEAFDIKPEESIMVEDSMKNIIRAKELGLQTVLITGKRKAGDNDHRADDAPDASHPSVDLAVETVDDLRKVMPSLWETTPTFNVTATTSK